MDIKQENQRHLEGWQGFMQITIWSSVGIAVILALMALFLT